MPERHGQSFKKPRPHPDDVQAPVERDDVRVLQNRCPFCHVDLDVEAEQWTACARCFARHHHACWTEAGACASCGGAQRLAPVREARSLGLSPAKPRPPGTLGERFTGWISRNAGQVLAFSALFLMLTVAIPLLTLRDRVFAIAIIAGIVGGLVISSPILIYAARKAKRRREAQRQAIQASVAARQGWQSYPVRTSSEAHFKSWWKVFPWEATGALTLGDAGVTLTTRTPGGATVERRFHPETATVEWIGRNAWPNGALSWFVIEQEGERTYFTSETGGTVFGSEASTREIFERVLAGATPPPEDDQPPPTPAGASL